MTPLAAYLLLFVAVGVGFILVHLVAGALLRPAKPGGEKDTIYECGEPTIGSAWIQFDLRYYVVALLFVVFDVEVAFFFPWAEVFGKANAVANAKRPMTAAEYRDYAEKVLDLAGPRGTDRASVEDFRRYDAMRAVTQEELDEMLAAQKAAGNRLEIGKPPPEADLPLLRMQGMFKRRLADAASRGDIRAEWEENREKAQNLALLALVEVLVFFGVLLVGFAYLWRRGDLQWVRSVAAEDQASRPAEMKAPELVGSR
ncbi:MAG: NADH-quinone oxidoreductase subunit A [Gemmataceae bacterium]